MLVCLYQRISLTAELIGFSLTGQLLIGTVKVFNYFLGGYHYPPNRNRPQNKLHLPKQSFITSPSSNVPRGLQGRRRWQNIKYYKDLHHRNVIVFKTLISFTIFRFYNTRNNPFGVLVLFKIRVLFPVMHIESYPPPPPPALSGT